MKGLIAIGLYAGSEPPKGLPNYAALFGALAQQEGGDRPGEKMRVIVTKRPPAYFGRSILLASIELDIAKPYGPQEV